MTDPDAGQVPTPQTARLRLALAQIDPTVGALDANAALIEAAIVDAHAAGADLVVLPELAVTGYPPEDLLLKPHFVEEAEAVLERIATTTAGLEGLVALVGCPVRREGLRNGLAVIETGEVVAIYEKVLLPNYGVFDERRYFEPGPGAAAIDIGPLRIGLTVCEDVWFSGPPSSDCAAAGASLIVNASASPYHRGKGRMREEMIAERAREGSTALALCNMTGGQDELVFDGHSVVCAADGSVLARTPQFEPSLAVIDLELPITPDAVDLSRTRLIHSTDLGDRDRGQTLSPPLAEPLEDVAEVYAALRTGLGDYMRKNGFSGAVLGLSGGIDSALVAQLAADALGAGNVTCVVMPSPHSSDETQGDARQIAVNLGCELVEVGIEPMMAAYDEALGPLFEGTEPGVAEENLQARIRGNIVMALSNKFGWLALTTGNKSEMSVGYATLYGDMAGGFAVIKDVPKNLVYELVRHRNAVAGTDLVPVSVIDRPPSAELRPDQKDTDSLPDYDILDAALAEYVENDGSRETMIAAGIEPEVADRVIRLVDLAEYKRRQAPPGVKITPKAFGRDRRLPITNRYGG